MADQTPNEEFLRFQEEANRITEKSLPIKKEELEHAEKNNELNRKIAAQLAQTSQSLKALGKSALDGQLGVTQFNQGIDAGVAGFSALSTFVGTFKLFAGPLGIALKVLTFGVGLAAKAFKTVNEQSEALFKSYQDLSKTGQSAAGGMTEVFNNMQKFGYGIKELDQMTALLKENSVALAAFGGTAATGSKAFADAAEQIQRNDIGKTFQLLGKTPDDINRGMALFIKQQQQSGVASSAINRDLAQQSAAYIKNLDTLSKLTGDDAAKLQEKLDAAMAEDAFNQTIYELKKKGAAGDVESARRATEYENAARRMTGESLKDFQRGVGGDIGAMSKTLMASSEAVGMIGKDSFTASGYIDALARGVTRQRDSMGSLFKLNAGGFMFSAKEMSEIQSRYATTTAKSQEELVQAQQEAQEKGIDPNTAAMVNARIEQMKTRDALQGLVSKGVGPATIALEGFSKAVNYITEKVPLTGSPNTKDKPIGGGGTGGGGTVGGTVTGGSGTGGGTVTGGGTPPPLKQDQAQNMELIKSALAKQGITDTKYVAATLGNVMKETQGRSIAENLDYRKTDNKRIQEIFGSRVAGKSASEIDQMKSSPENFGEAMYGAKTDIGRRMGNMEPGDGWKYRGRGFIQLTGKSNYAEASRAIYGDDRLVKDPDLVLQPLVAAEVTAWYMKKTQGMAKGMGINIKDMSQEQANVLATSQVAGRDVRKAGGYLGGENLAKVNQYAAQQLKTTQVASTPAEQKKTTTVAPVEKKETTTAVAPVEKKETDPRRMTTAATPSAATAPSTPPSDTTPSATAVAPVEKKETDPRRMTTADRLQQEQEKTRALLGNGTAREESPKNLTVSGNLVMGKPSGPIEYNGRTVKPEDLDYAEASKVLVASMEKIDSAKRRAQEARASVASDRRNTMPQGEIVGTGDPAKISGANGFRGMLTGPTSGYKPDLTMHGTEQLTIKPTSNTETSPGSIGTNQIMTQQLSKMDQLVQAFNNTNTQDMMSMQLDRLDELVRVMQNQVSVSTKILQQSR